MDAYAYEWMNMDDHDVTLNEHKWEAMAIDDHGLHDGCGFCACKLATDAYPCRCTAARLLL